MSKRGGEIAALKAAEEEATEIISAAREERKLKLRSAIAEAKKEVEDYKTLREAKLRTVQPEAEALNVKLQKTIINTDRSINALDAEYQHNKEPMLQMLMQIVMNIENPYRS